MNKQTNKGKAVLFTGFLCTAIMSGSVLAEKVDFTASTHINRGTCTITSGTTGLVFDFGAVTPRDAFGGQIFNEQSFKLNDCVAVNNITVSLTSPSTTEIISGDYAGKWVVPAQGGATGVAYKTLVKNGLSADYFPLQADGLVPDTGDKKFVTEWSIYIKATLVPTVAATSEMVAGNLASAAVLNISYQ